ncbi:3-oxoacyl-[acyl-carrier-protein] reductase [[Clostridium] polysaccharolyticum]|uniref:3-oxoacyl-[acyl-carrier-protein] reductase n=1 Tax=[Clostridium] polysaccharolyticum TaxID=29364 RepID=A0A1I0D740_9FIRM|nr:3-oxoacyl-[acyl-carrier-protein] reductase [[Clostridium] polysaccharolyticum]SET27444.1 3-oxoacyl-[acyl-carrier-protein] reductase [[Clostridium] polysaccharolyticum]
MFKEKVALVTGASRGIGRAIAMQLAAKGAKVIVNYAGNQAAADAVVKEINEQGGEAFAYQCNVNDFTAVKEMIDYIVKEYGAIDILVNNAGITKDNLLLKMSEQDFDSVMDVNLKGCFHTCKHVLRPMLKNRGGRIINITSVVGVTGNSGQANYSASKAGIIGFTKSVAKEVAAKGITVNAVAPGFIQTDMTDVLSESVKNDITNSLPMKRIGAPEDVANAVCFLASDDASYITGQVLEVNGGMNM